jgi:hypothetical protein
MVANILKMYQMFQNKIIVILDYNYSQKMPQKPEL